MDRRSWLWRRKSSEKSPGETESSTSVSSHSERYSDDQELSRASPNDASVGQAQSREVLCNASDGEVHETVKRLTEKLSVALLKISAKEDLVKQHAKVAEEAVSGWEQAEAEVVALKQQLQTTLQKNSAREDKISQLDGALKECVRQLHQSREEEEEEEKVRYSISEKTQMWGSEKHVLEKQLVELTAQLEAAKTKAGTFDHGSKARLEAVEKENMALKTELRSRSEDIQVLLLESELSNKAAETASKQHLESIKKVTKLEAECSRLQIANRRSSSASVHKPISCLACVESLADSRSDSGERSLGIDNGPGRSDSWASALIAELDQFKSEKADSRILTGCPVEIELMDDFLEMEKLVALPETDPGNSDLEPEADSNQLVVRRYNLREVDNEFMHHMLIELEEKVERLEHEKAELEIASTESRNRLEASRSLVTAAESKVVELQTKLDMENESKQTATSEFMDLEGKRKELETQLESAYLENGKLCEKVSLLEESSKSERESSFELKASIDNTEAAREALNSRLESAHSQLRSLNETIGVLEQQVKEERAFSSELASKVKASESQLEHAHSEASKLQEKANFWELKAEEETKLSAEIAIKLEATEAARKKLELELQSAHEFATKAEAVEAAKKALEIQLDSALGDTGKLSDKLALCEAKIDEERALSAEFAAKCRKLEADLSKIKQEADLRRAANPNPQLKIKQEKELAVAAGKLEECQKTIASLNRQLKSLTYLDDFMLRAEKPEHDGSLQDPGGSKAKDFHHNDSTEVEGSCTLPDGKESIPLQSSFYLLSSSSSSLSGFVRSLPHSRSISH